MPLFSYKNYQVVYTIILLIVINTGPLIAQKEITGQLYEKAIEAMLNYHAGQTAKGYGFKKFEEVYIWESRQSRGLGDSISSKKIIKVYGSSSFRPKPNKKNPLYLYILEPIKVFDNKLLITISGVSHYYKGKRKTLTAYGDFFDVYFKLEKGSWKIVLTELRGI